MFATLKGNLSTLCHRTTKTSLLRFLSKKAESDSFTELKKVATSTPGNAATVFDIDELIANLPSLRDAHGSSSKYDEYAFGNSVKDPREAAKAISIYGPALGRTVDVRFQNVGIAFKEIHSVLKQNEIRSQWHNQKRYIRPAKFRKMKKRVWWRKHFARRFSDLMAQITDAKRRGY